MQHRVTGRHRRIDLMHLCRNLPPLQFKGMNPRHQLARTFVLLFIPGLSWGNLELANAALERTKEEIVYDGSYRSIVYPGGDVPSHIGVCTDMVIRSFRTLGVDLQVLVHEDMTANFDDYPANWGLTKPDTNIDHRRVPNLEVFFARHGESINPDDDLDAFKPGDIVSWRLGGNLPHIGIVSPNKDPVSQRPLIIHNIGRGPKEEDVLFRYRMTGHFRYTPPAD